MVSQMDRLKKIIKRSQAVKIRTIGNGLLSKRPERFKSIDDLL